MPDITKTPSANCRYCFNASVGSCSKCYNLDFYDLLQSIAKDRRLYQRKRKAVDWVAWTRTATTCRFCALLNDGIQAIAVLSPDWERNTILVEFVLGESLTLVLANNSFRQNYGAAPQIEFFTDDFRRMKYTGWEPVNQSPVAATAIGRRPVIGGFFTEATAKLLQTWLKPMTSAIQALPRRLIDVGLAPYDSQNGVKVIDTSFAHSNEEYVTLSHCWVGRDILMSTRDSIQFRMQGIELSTLPPVFLDAVRACRFIGIRYLWIDSLCILQGDQEEWKLEVSRLDEIYENARLAIIVEEDDEKGFIPRPTSHQLRDMSDMEAAIFVREIKTPAFLNPSGVFFRDRKDLNPAFAHARGWCYQERYLSSQMLHFTRDEVLYECKNRIQCQCGNHNIYIRDQTQSDPSRQWRIILREFTERAMTHKWDLLPGIAGIARRFSRSHATLLGRYIAGLWENDLLKWLCWKTSPQYTQEAMRGQCELCRPWPKRIPLASEEGLGDEYIIPSWSWAARAGPCKVPKFLWSGVYSQTVELLEMKIEAEEHELYTRMHDASILLRGPSKQAYLYSSTDRTHGPGQCEREFVYLCDMATHNELVDTGVHWYDELVKKKRGWEIIQDAADDIPANGTEVLLLKMFEGDSIALDDKTFDDEKGADMPKHSLVSHMPETLASDLVALVLLKDDRNTIVPKPNFHRRIGIMFLTPVVDLADISTVLLR